MNRQTFTWGAYRNQINQQEFKIESLYILGLLLAALLLFCSNLGSLPLRDWDEATVAQVAKEIFQAPSGSLKWLFPTLWGEPYLNKPPLLHNLIAVSFSLGGVNEWTARLPGAILTALSVPLLYGIGREIFVSRTPAFFSALVYLTLLPVVRNGRLAMLDGAVLCFQMLMFWSILRSRRDLRWSVLFGIGFALISLTKGMMGLLLAAIALSFIFWDTPRILTSIYLWLGIFIGSMPVFGWYIAQWLHNSDGFITTNIINQSLKRIYTPVENNSGPPWYYLLEIIKYSFPWFIFAGTGLRSCWSNRNWSSAKLILIWSGLYFTVVSIMMTKLPWYILPIYPAVALAAGAKLAELRSLPHYYPWPPVWKFFFLVASFLAAGGCIYFSFFNHDPSVVVILGLAALTCGMSAVLISQRERQFIPLLFWGMYVTLFLFVCSPHWNWELNEAYQVKPVAAIIDYTTPNDEVVYTNFAYERPSLNFYSDRRIISASNEELIEFWQNESTPFLLIDKDSWKELNLQEGVILGSASPDWVIVTKKI